jgi:DNA-binding NarL/FixJ family response regulator
MIHIAIADPNETYCRSLKTVLEQIDGFNVMTVDADTNSLIKSDDVPVDVLLIDIGLFLNKNNRIKDELSDENKSLKIILLAMYEDDLAFRNEKAEVILKSAGKKKFEHRIRQMVSVDVQNDSSSNAVL